MTTVFRSLQFTVLAALITFPNWVAAQTTQAVLSYATTGSEHVRSYDAASGWSEAVRTYTGKFDLLTTTDARLTKIYAEGSAVARDLIFQWVVDPNAPAQSGGAAEVPDPTDPLIERTTYVIVLKFDGVHYSMSGSFTTRAYFAVSPGIYDWFNVAYGDFSGFLVSPLGTYNITGSEKTGKTTLSYAGTFSLFSTISAQLAKIFADGSTSTVDLVLETPVDLQAPIQTLSATQVQNLNNQLTTYSLNLQLSDRDYVVSSSYTTAQVKGKSVKEIRNGIFMGAQPY